MAPKPNPKCALDHTSVGNIFSLVQGQFDVYSGVLFVHPHSLFINDIAITAATTFETDLMELMLTDQTRPTTFYLLQGTLPAVSDRSDPIRTLPVSFSFADIITTKHLDHVASVTSSLANTLIVRFAESSLPWHFFKRVIGDHAWTSGLYLDQVRNWVVSQRSMRKILAMKQLANVDEWENESHFDAVCRNASFADESKTDNSKCEHKITVVISTFSEYRQKRLKLLIEHYTAMSVVHQVVVVWQDIRAPALSRLKSFQYQIRKESYSKPVTFLQQTVCFSEVNDYKS